MIDKYVDRRIDKHLRDSSDESLERGLKVAIKTGSTSWGFLLIMLGLVELLWDGSTIFCPYLFTVGLMLMIRAYDMKRFIEFSRRKGVELDVERDSWEKDVFTLVFLVGIFPIILVWIVLKILILFGVAS
jgi:hypothetical protein